MRLMNKISALPARLGPLGRAGPRPPRGGSRSGRSEVEGSWRKMVKLLGWVSPSAFLRVMRPSGPGSCRFRS